MKLKVPLIFLAVGAGIALIFIGLPQPEVESTATHTPESTREVEKRLPRESSGPGRTIPREPEVVEDIAKQGGTLDPDMAKSLLGRLRSEVPDALIRASLGGSIIENLVRNGYDEAAWGLIEPNFGVMRDLQLRAYFASSKDPGNIEKINALTDKNEKLRSVQGFLGALAYKELLQTDLTTLGITGNYKRVLASELSMELNQGTEAVGDSASQHKAKNLEILEGVAAMVNRGTLSPEDLYSVMKQERACDPFEHMSVLDQIEAPSNATTEKELQSVRGKVVGQMIEADAPRAMRDLISTSSSASLIDDAIQQWLEIDNGGAVAWHEAHRSELTGDQKDYLAAGFALHALQHGEKESAESWLGEIRNDDIKSPLRKRLK